MLRHDLHVHQEELQAQNEKLLATLQALEETHLRYLELYDASPVGYCTLDAAGVIRELNLAAAGMLGRPRASLAGVPMGPFVAPDDRQRFRRYLQVCARVTGEHPESEELHLATPSGERVAQLACRPRAGRSRGRVELLVSMIDVTERRRLEAAREEGRREQAQLVREMLSAQEAERQRIARDIHDDLGQQVTGLRLKLQWLATAVPGGHPLAERVAAVQAAATQLDQHVDFLIRDLRPAGLEHLGLPTVLRQTVADWSSTFGIAAEFRAAQADPRRLDPEVEVQVFRIVQEALNNIHKHAAATHVVVSLERRQGRTIVSVGDNGIGMPRATPPSLRGTRGRLGLLGMRERAALIGGELSVVSTPGRGTTVAIAVS
jgi:PAS domain S-box-containing protein